jgi:hypothetical protein
MMHGVDLTGNLCLNALLGETYLYEISFIGEEKIKNITKYTQVRTFDIDLLDGYIFLSMGQFLARNYEGGLDVYNETIFNHLYKPD